MDTRARLRGSARARATEGVSILPLVLEGVSFQAGGQRLLQDVTLHLAAGTRTIVLGPNGAGKTLLLKLCHGLLQPSAGHLRWNNPAVSRQPGAQAMVLQRPVLLRRSVRKNIDYVLRVAGLGSAERPLRLQQALDFAGLASLAKRPARVLSGGEQQRLALARAWVLTPQVLFLDEPTSHLDPSATRRVEEMIAAIAGTGTKIIMSTHDLGQAKRLAQEVVFLHQGRLVEAGDAGQFFAGPRTAAGSAFIEGRLLW